MKLYNLALVLTVTAALDAAVMWNDPSTYYVDPSYTTWDMLAIDLALVVMCQVTLTKYRNAVYFPVAALLIYTAVMGFMLLVNDNTRCWAGHLSCQYMGASVLARLCMVLAR